MLSVAIMWMLAGIQACCMLLSPSSIGLPVEIYMRKNTHTHTHTGQGLLCLEMLVVVSWSCPLHTVSGTCVCLGLPSWGCLFWYWWGNQHSIAEDVCKPSGTRTSNLVSVSPTPGHLVELQWDRSWLQLTCGCPLEHQGQGNSGVKYICRPKNTVQISEWPILETEGISCYLGHIHSLSLSRSLFTHGFLTTSPSILSPPSEGRHAETLACLFSALSALGQPSDSILPFPSFVLTEVSCYPPVRSSRPLLSHVAVIHLLKKNGHTV